MNRSNIKLNYSQKTAVLCIGFVVIFFLTLFGAKLTRAEWREPGLSPATEQIPAPITTGPEDQTKEGFLELSSEYIPTDANSLNFDPQKPLDVRGNGAKFSTPYVYSNVLRADAPTFYANAVTDWVGVGATTKTANVRLKIEGGTVRLGSLDDPMILDIPAVTGYGSEIGISGDAGTQGVAGVYGIQTATAGYAARGTSTSGSGVYGNSFSGQGVYGRSASATYAGVYGENTTTGWAGYFDGRLGSDTDVVSNRFLPTNLQRSLIPFTSGELVQRVMTTETNPGGSPMVKMAIDGSNIWAIVTAPLTGNKDLFKFRLSDGAVLLSLDTDAATDLQNIQSIVFDGSNIWAGDDRGYLTKRSIITGEMTGRYDLDGGGGRGVRALTVSTDDQGRAFIWASLGGEPNNGVNYLAKVEAANPANVSYSPSVAGRILGLTFDGSNIWALMEDGAVLKNSTASPVTWGTSYSVPGGHFHNYSMTFDGEYIWVVSYTANTIIRLYAADPGNSDGRHPQLTLPMATIMGIGDPHLKGITFDGTYLWISAGDVDVAGGSQNGVLRLSASVNTNNAAVVNSLLKTYRTVLTSPNSITFDGSYIWVSTYALGNGLPLELDKFYSGTGMGQTDLNSVVNLSTSSTPAAQAGSINITGAAVVGDAAGDTLTVNGDLSATGNTWGGSDQTPVVSGGAATCPGGMFIKGININPVDGKLEGGSIICRGL